MNLYSPKVIIIFFVLLITTAILGSIIRERKNSREFSKFELVDKDSEFSGVIISLRKYRGNTLVEMNNGRKYWLKLAKNYNNNPNFLDDFLKENDSLLKPFNNDTIYIIRDQNRYYFLNDTIVH